MYRDLIGKPFQALGRGPEAYDCWGLVIEVARRIGIEVPDYGVDPDDPDSISDKFYEVEGNYKVVSSAQRGDIVLYKRMDGGLHFGIMVNSLDMLHVSRALGVHGIRIDNPLMKQLIKRIYRKCK